MKKRKTTNRIAVILVAFAVTFTFMPLAEGSFDASAASPYWRSYKAAQKNTAVRVSWKKLTKAQQKKITGIVVYRNGKAVKKLKKTAASYTDAKVKAGRTYKYSLKTYKKTIKKVRVYYNNKTKKWQTKKISGAKTKLLKKTKYVYRNASPVKKIKVKAVKKASEDAAAPAGQAKTGAGQSSTQSQTGNQSGQQSSSGTSSKSGTSGDANKTQSGSTKPASQGSTAQPSSGSNTSGTSAGQSSTSGGGSESGASETEPVIPTSGGEEPGDSTEPETEPVTFTGRTIPIQSYDNKFNVVYREMSNGMWYGGEGDWDGTSWPTYEELETYVINDPRWNHLIDGEFDSDDGHMIQRNGATFLKSELEGQVVRYPGYTSATMPDSERWGMDRGFVVQMWGGDASKLTYEMDHQMSTVDSYVPVGINTFNSVKVKYIDSNNTDASGKRKHLITVVNTGVYQNVNSANNHKVSAPQAFVLNFKTVEAPNCGFVSEDIAFTIKYDGEKIGEIVWNPNPDAVNGMLPNKALAYSIAKQAIEAKGRDTTGETELIRCCQEMYKIRDYIEETYTYGEEVTGEGGARLLMGCEGGASVLEAWAVMEYGYDGFWGCKNKDPSDGHRSFNLNIDPTLQFDAAGGK